MSLLMLLCRLIDVVLKANCGQLLSPHLDLMHSDYQNLPCQGHFLLRASEIHFDLANSNRGYL